MPFSTSLLAEFITFRLALFIYWLNIFVVGLSLYATAGTFHARSGGGSSSGSRSTRSERCSAS